MSDSLNMIRAKVPGVPLLPSLGNNDLYMKNQVPCQDMPGEKWFY